jgi:hypothetical protein
MAGCDDSDSPDDSEQGEAYGSWGGDDEGPSADGPSCTNTCEYANDGDCDDGGPNSDFSLCAYGTDCGDCGPRDGGEPVSSDDEDPVAQEWACEFIQHSRTACPGTPNSISESDRCVTVTAASASEAEAACSEYTSSDTDCYGSCCTRSYGTDRSVYEGSCY